MRKLLIVICLLFLMLACDSQPSTLEKARELVAIGESREEAIEILSKEAWYHQPCGDSEDLFFYGDHHYDRAVIVIVESVLKDGEYKVGNIGSFDEPNPWHTLYGRCIDRTRFED